MRDFLANKHNVAVSAYITDKIPSAIQTNGALTIIDNTDPNNGNITGLVPNTHNIFLDNTFLAAGYGFSSYNQSYIASYIVNTNEGAIYWLVNEIDKIHNQEFNLKYSYANSENKIDKVYNSYGWLKEYKKIDVINSSEDNTSTIKLSTVKTNYINDIQLKIIGGKNLYGESPTTGIVTRDLNYNYFDIGDTAQIEIDFIKGGNEGGGDDSFKETAPSIYLSGEEGNITLEYTNSDNNISYFYIGRNYGPNQSAPNTYGSRYDNKDISIICKRHDDIVYSYTFIKALKWRHKILPFNTELISLFDYSDTITGNSNISLIYALDNSIFTNSLVINANQLDWYSNLSIFNSFIKNNINDAMFLDDETNIEYSGLGYKYNNIIYYAHDYFIIESGIDHLDFYFNGIKTNNWNYIEFTDNDGKSYRLYQSAQRYVGKHTWTIKYRDE